MLSELMGIQQNLSFISEGYTDLGEKLKSRAEELSSLLQEVKEAQKETEDMMTWLKDMKKTAASWNNEATERDSVKTQLEQQKVLACCCSPNGLLHYIAKKKQQKKKRVLDSSLCKTVMWHSMTEFNIFDLFDCHRHLRMA